MESLSYDDTDLNSRQEPTMTFNKLRNRKFRRIPGGGICHLGIPISVSEFFFGSLSANTVYCYTKGA
jgi:hypothetical protein